MIDCGLYKLCLAMIVVQNVPFTVKKYRQKDLELRKNHLPME